MRNIAYLAIRFAGLVKLFVNMDKNIPANGGELPAMELRFVSSCSEEAGRGERLKGAAHEIMEGFGAVDERREKDVLVAAAEAFADHSESFVFDRPTSSGGKRNSAIGRRATGSGGSLLDSGRTMSSSNLRSSGRATSSSSSSLAGNSSHNGNLFDKAGDSSGRKRRKSVSMSNVTATASR